MGLPTQGRKPYPLLALVAAILLLGLWTGLERIGLIGPSLSTGRAMIHGPLMVSGALGTLICMERAVALAALRKNRAYSAAFLAPLLTGLGAGLLALNPALGLARLLLVLGSLGLVLVFAAIVRLHRAAFTATMAAGALCWLAGNALWLAGQPIYQVVHWWIAFLVLTIVGERLELAHIRHISPSSQRLFLVAVGIFLGGVALTLFDLGMGIRLAGAGEIALALWLLRYDIARRTIRRTGLPRFIAACLLIGYGWLGIGGLIGLWQGALYAGPMYGTLLHALLLGFVFSMIFGHAPIIIPALTGRMIRFDRTLYVPLLILHGALLLRVASNLAGSVAGRQWGGLFNVVAILVYIGMMARLLLADHPAVGQGD